MATIKKTLSGIGFGRGESRGFLRRAWEHASVNTALAVFVDQEELVTSTSI